MTPGQKKRVLKAEIAVALQRVRSNLYLKTFYLMTLSLFAISLPKSIRKRKVGRSEPVCSMRFEEDHRFNVRWLRGARRVLKPDATLWVSVTYHIIFSLGLTLQNMGFKIINQIVRSKPDPVPSAQHTTFTHAHEILIWASKNRRSSRTFNYGYINSQNANAQVCSVWCILTGSRREKLQGYHPTQKHLILVRRALLASTREGDLVFDPFVGSGTAAVAAKELNRVFVGAELEEGFAVLAARRVAVTERGSLSREISEQFWSGS